MLVQTFRPSSLYLQFADTFSDHKKGTMSTKLIAIVQVDRSARVQCQQPGCGHSVWKAVHVIVDDEGVSVLGSSCFERRFGSATALGPPSYGSGGGRCLTAEERELLVSNTRELISRFEREHEQQLADAQAKLSSMRQAALRLRTLPTAPRAGPQSKAPFEPSRNGQWAWQKPLSSMAYFRLKDGTGWVRVQRRDGQQMVAPLPMFDGWNEALPRSFGTPDEQCSAYAVNNIEHAVAYLRSYGQYELVSGVWKEILEASRRAAG